jgi:hypothetical protein
MTVLVSEICDGIATTLGAATGIVVHQSYDELTEGWQDVPMLQCYPESGEVNALSDGSQNTFRGGSRVHRMNIWVDVPCRVRSHIDEDMAAVVTILDALTAVMDAQKIKPYFTVPEIQGFHWTWTRVNFSRGDPAVVYPGIRLIIIVTVF